MTPTPQELVAALALAFPKTLNDLGKERGAEFVRFYVHWLSDLPPDVLADAVNEMVATRRWFPTIAEIREVVAERVLALPGTMEALAQIDSIMASRNAPALHPLVAETLHNVGGYSAFRYTEASIIRGQFGNLYREARAHTIRQYQINPKSLTPPEKPPELPVARNPVS